MTPELFFLMVAAGIVGFLIGAVGVGGILLIPALIGLAGLTPHQASATALFTFIFTGLLGTFLFQRQGSIDWRQTLVVCAGAIVCSYLGAIAKAAVGDVALMRVIAMLLIMAGAYVFMPRSVIASPIDAPPRYPLLFLIGAVAGFGSGFSGAGGPLFSVPLMVASGFNTLLSIGTSQVLQVFSAASGSAANLRYGDIQWSLVTWVTASELVGVVAGAKLAHAVGANRLRVSTGLVCLLVGIGLLIQHR